MQAFALPLSVRLDGVVHLRWTSGCRTISLS